MRKRKQSQSGRSAAPLFLVALGALLILGSVGWYAYQAFGGAAEDTPVVQTAEEDTPGVARVSLEDAKAAYDQGVAVFLDVRTQAEYDERHIPGALSIPLDELPGRIGELDRDDWIITY